MEKTNLDLDLPLTAEQWDILVKTAEELGPERCFRAEQSDPPEIEVVLTPDRAPSGWREWLTDEATRGRSRQPVARFTFNDGRPHGSIEPWAEPAEPAVLQPRVEELQEELERWVRGRWHELLEESGIDYVRGHVPQS